MGSNVFIKDVDTKGYKTESAETAIEQNIAGKPGKRIAIRAFGVVAGAGAATDIYFMQTIGTTTLTAAGVSGNTTIEITSKSIIAGAAIATSDNAVVLQDDGTYLFATVTLVTSLRMTLSTALTDGAAVGNMVYGIGINTDTGHNRYHLTSGQTVTKELDGGLFYAAAKGYPAIFQYDNATSGAGYIQYVTIDYINK